MMILQNYISSSTRSPTPQEPSYWRRRHRKPSSQNVSSRTTSLPPTCLATQRRWRTSGTPEVGTSKSTVTPGCDAWCRRRPWQGTGQYGMTRGKSWSSYCSKKSGLSNRYGTIARPTTFQRWSPNRRWLYRRASHVSTNITRWTATSSSWTRSKITVKDLPRESMKARSRRIGL